MAMHDPAPIPNPAKPADKRESLVLMHHHLNRGGVTRVIENQLYSIDSVLKGGSKLPVQIFYGGRASGWSDAIKDKLQNIDLSLRPLSDLDYDQETGGVSPAKLSEGLLRNLAARGLSPEHTVVHCHNHSLGKNAALPKALKALAQSEYGMLLQIHDFAEDLRPDNYRHLMKAHASDASALYPQAERIHYAVLNQRDFAVLDRAGLDAERLHFLPNPVAAPENLPSYEVARERLEQAAGLPRDERLILYPVRGIGRKNVGEFLLWSALVPEKTTLAMTLGPVNPKERAVYDHWKAFAADEQLPVMFELGETEGLGFEDCMCAADKIISTSVAEGFGMAFLECWLYGKSLMGRDLPEITADFKSAGLKLDGLQDAIWIPLDWTGGRAFVDCITEYYGELTQKYDIEDVVGETEAASKKVKEGLVDFADLSAELQMTVLKKVMRDPSKLETIKQLNPKLVKTLGFEDESSLLEENKRLAGAEFSFPANGSRLQDIYSSVREAQVGPVTGLSDARSIVDSFIDPSRIRVLR